MQLQLTTAGAALFQSAGGPITLTSYVLGDGYNYTASGSDINIHGNQVYTGVPSIATPQGSNEWVYSILMDSTVGNFQFGEVGLFHNSTLVALAVAPALIQKTKTGSVLGNVISLNVYLQQQNNTFNLWLTPSVSDSKIRIATLPSADNLPSAHGSGTNIYLISGGSGNSAFEAYTDTGNLWTFDGYYAGQPIATSGNTTQSVTIPLSSYATWMNPNSAGQVLLQVTSSASLTSSVRTVSSVTLTSSTATINFATPLTSALENNAQVTLYTTKILASQINLPIASSSTLGAIKVGTGLAIATDGTLNATYKYTLPIASSTVPGGVLVGNGLNISPTGVLSAVVTGVAGRTGNINLTTTDIGGLARVASTGNYSDLIGKPNPLAPATSTNLGGVVVPAVGTSGLTIDVNGNLAAAVRTVAGVSPTSGNVPLSVGNITGAAPLASPALTGTPTAPTAILGDNSTKIATTAFVQQTLLAQPAIVRSFNGRTGTVTLQLSDITGAGGAPLASPTFTGTPRAPTVANVQDSSTSIATTAFVQNAIANIPGTVISFNGRSGSVVLTLNDITGAGGAPINNTNLIGQPTAPTPTVGDNSTNIATTAFVARAISNISTGVISFNGRSGIVTLQQADVSALGFASLTSPAFSGNPTAPTVATNDSSTNVATTAFVKAALAANPAVTSFNTRTGAVTLTTADILEAGGAPLTNPQFIGSPTAPTAAPGTATTQLATTAFVATALSNSVTSFNTRTGSITLTGSDITSAGGALLASPTFTGTPSAPTATVGTNTTQIATTAFVGSAIAAIPQGVSSFNTRTGAVTLTGTDITNAGGALLASPAFTGTPTAPTRGSSDNSTSIATTAFVGTAVSNATTSIQSNLAAANGAASIGYQNTGTGTVVRNVLARLQDRMDLRDFGVQGNGSNSDAASVQNAVTAAVSAGEILWAPPGNFILDSGINIPGVLRLAGDGMNTSIFTYTPVNGNAFTWTADGSYSEFDRVKLFHNQPRVVGNTATGFKFYTGSACVLYQFDRVWVEGFQLWGYDLNDSFNCKFTNGRIRNNGVIASLAGGGTDGQGGGMQLSRITFTGAATTGNDYTNMYITGNNWGVQVQPSGNNNKAFNTRFDMCIFESNYIGVDLRNMGTGGMGRYQFLNTCYGEANIFALAMMDEGSSVACYQNNTTPGTGTPPSTSLDGPDGINFAGRFVEDRPSRYRIGNQASNDSTQNVAFAIDKNASTNYVSTMRVLNQGTLQLVGGAGAGVPAVTFNSGSGSPEASITANNGSLYMRYTGVDLGTTLYLKVSGTGNTGWLPLGPQYGPTAARPASTSFNKGQFYYDTDILRVVTANGLGAWREYNGLASVTGTYSAVPSGVTGASYYATDLSANLTWDGATWAMQTLPISFVSVAAAGNTTIPNRGGHVIGTTTGSAVATFTLNLPAAANVVTKDRARFTTSCAITALTVSASGATVVNAPSSMNAGQTIEFVYNNSSTTWYRIA